jgi:uncharacterized protein YkwD
MGLALIAFPASPVAAEGTDPSTAAGTGTTLAAAAGTAGGAASSKGTGQIDLGTAVAEQDQSGQTRAGAAGVTTTAIDRDNKVAVAQAYQNYALNLRTVAMGWTGSTAGCSVGNVSSAAQQATLQTVNYLRQMVGLADVTENADASSAARKTALMMQANGQLTHYPPTSWRCFSNNGAFLASRSNIALGSGGDGILAGAKAIFAYVNDVGVDSLGHRRWVLSPVQRTIGIGSTSNANAMVWGNGSGTCTSTSCTVSAWNPSEDASFTNTYGTSWTSPQTVAWPAAGYFPYQLTKSEYDSRQMDWSVAAGTSAISFASATVAVTKNGVAVSGLSLIPQSSLGRGYGDQGAFGFRFPTGAVTLPGAGKVDTYRVTISGIGGISGGRLQYDVKMINALEASVGAVSISGTPRVGQTLTAQVSGVTPAGATLAYQWLRGGTVAVGSNSSTYTPVDADYGQTISVKVTASKTGFTSVPVTSAAVGPVTALPMSVAKPVISGAAKVGQPLSVAAVATDPAGGTVKYEWFVGGVVAKSGTDAAARSFTPTTANGGKSLYVKVTATRSGYRTATNQSDTLTIMAVADGCSIAQAMITPRLWSHQGASTTGTWATQHAQVLRVCANGDMRLYTQDPATLALSLTSVIGWGWQNLKVVTPGDWNGDGFNDVIAVDTAGKVWLYPRDSANRWGARKQIASGWQGYSRVVAVGDITKDGKPDILVVDGQGRLFRYQGDGKGGWRNSGARTQIGGGWSSFQLLAAGDMNRDGIGDIMSVNRDGKLFWYPSTGYGFGAPQQIGAGWNAFRPITGASMNGDLVGDLISVSSVGTVRFYPGRGQASFAPAVIAAAGWL